MKKRLKFKCCNPKCKREYSLLKEITDEQELIVACPYCNQEGVVRLGQFKKISVFRGSAKTDAATAYEYDFPDVIPTQAPE